MNILRFFKLAAFTFSAFVSVAAHAQSGVGNIESLVAPVFLDRGGLSVPASAGIALQVGDRLRTGAGGRLLLRLSEGSAVRLGENAAFVVESARRKGAVYEAALSVLQGAFRFTTATIAKAQPRDIKINLARNATIGIRGTDLWGRGREDKDIVCLLEGKIDVTGNDNQTRKLDQPLQFFQSKRNEAPEPLAFIELKQVLEWAKETDIPEGTGATAKGTFKLVIGGFASRDAMLSASRRLRDAGYAVDRSDKNTLSIANLASEADATAMGERLKAAFGFATVTVAK